MAEIAAAVEAFVVEHVLLELGTILAALKDVPDGPDLAALSGDDIGLLRARLASIETRGRAVCQTLARQRAAEGTGDDPGDNLFLDDDATSALPATPVFRHRA